MQKAIGYIRISTQGQIDLIQRQAAMKRKPIREMQRLFGEPVVFLATITDPATLDLSAALMDRVHDGADALLTMRGNLPEQHRYISGLPFTERLVLCMWLMDMNLAAKLVRAVYAKV